MNRRNGRLPMSGTVTGPTYLAVPDPADPQRITYWRRTDRGLAEWPRGARYGPRLTRADLPAGLTPVQQREYASAWYQEQARPWHDAIIRALDADPAGCAARFAALTVRCYWCARKLTDPTSKGLGRRPRVPQRLGSTTRASASAAGHTDSETHHRKDAHPMTQTDSVQARIDTIAAAITTVRASRARTQLPAGLNALVTHYGRQLAEKVLDGQLIPEDLAEQVDAARRDAEARIAARGALDAALVHLGGLLEAAQRDAAPARLRVLDAELQRLVDDVRQALADLGDARTADAAIDSGPAAVAAWQRLDEAVGRYGGLRRSQRAIVADVIGDAYIARERVERYGILADLAAVWPDSHRFNRGERGDPAPWPHEQGRPYEALAAGGRDFLVWAAESGARLWIPRLGDLKAAEDQARALAAGRDYSPTETSAASTFVGHPDKHEELIP